MSITADDPAQRAAYWPLPLARAVPTAALALVITFSADHSARFGLVVFGAFALLAGIVIAAVSAMRLRGSGPARYVVAQGVASALLGALALVSSGGGVGMFFLVVTAWAAVTGALELWSGFRYRGRHVAANDWLVVGAITAVTALVFLLLPPDFRQEFVGEQQVSGVLDSSIVAVGLLGAYAAIVTVYLAIAGLSARWGTDPADIQTPLSSKEQP